MARAEHDLPGFHLTELKTHLGALETRLELADENENPIERTAIREGLLERLDQLQADIEAIELPTENAQSVSLQAALDDKTGKA
jgi:hypothetical protein